MKRNKESICPSLTTECQKPSSVVDHMTHFLSGLESNIYYRRIIVEQNGRWGRGVRFAFTWISILSSRWDSAIDGRIYPHTHGPLLFSAILNLNLKQWNQVLRSKQPPGDTNIPPHTHHSLIDWLIDSSFLPFFDLTLVFKVQLVFLTTSPRTFHISRIDPFPHLASLAIFPASILGL